MRVQLVPAGTGELTYEIRNIVNVAEKLQKCGVTINWENIGDPIVKGEQIPGWMKSAPSTGKPTPPTISAIS